MKLERFVNKVMEFRPHPPASLFHYCRAESLKYLIHRDSDIWCTHCNHLNDPEECWTGIRLFLKYLKEKSLFPSEAYQMFEQSARGNSLLHKLLAKDGHSPIMPFSFSFSEVGENDKMWNYAAPCGYRLEFDSDRLEQNAGRVQTVLSVINPKNRMSLSLWPCFYEESNQDEIQQLFDAYVVDVKHLLKCISEDPNDEETGRRLLSSLATISPIIKSEKWSYEKEWRLIMVREDFNRIAWRNHRARSYLSSTLGGIRSIVKSIRVCPEGDVEWEKRYLEYEVNDGFRGGEREFL